MEASTRAHTQQKDDGKAILEAHGITEQDEMELWRSDIGFPRFEAEKKVTIVTLPPIQ